MATKLSDSGPAGSVLGGNLSPDALIAFIIEDARLKRQLDEANAKYRAHRSKGEKQGVDLKVLADLTRLSKMDDGERVAHLRKLFRYADITETKVGEQAELFPEVKERPTEKSTASKNLWAAEDAGYQIAINNGEASANPFDAGTEAFQRWDLGFRNGQAFLAGKAEINPEAGRKAKQVKEVSARRGGGRPKQTKRNGADAGASA